MDTNAPRKAFTHTVFRGLEGHQTHYTKFILFYLALFFTSTSVSILWATLWPYILDTHKHNNYPYLVLSFSVSAYGIGELIAIPLFSYKPQKSRIKHVLLISFAVSILGGLLYCSIPIWLGIKDIQYWWVFILSRLITGIGKGGENSGTRTFAGRYIVANDRNKYLLRIRVVTSVGFIVGPTIAIAFHFMGKRIALGSDSRYGHIDEFTGPGYLQACLGVVSFILWALFFTERRFVFQVGDDTERAPQAPVAPQMKLRSNRNSLSLFVFIIFFATFFINTLTFVVNETVATPIMMDTFKFGTVSSNYVYIIVGGINILVTIVMELFGQHFDARISMVLGLVLQTAGYLTIIDYDGLTQIQFFIGFSLLNLGFPITRLAMFYQASKLGRHVNNNFLLSCMVFSGLLGRIILPHWNVPMYFASG